MSEVLVVIECIFHRLPNPFVDGEERRLAAIVYSSILNGSCSQEAVSNWLSQVVFPLEQNSDYFKLAAFESFLASVYFHLFKQIQFEQMFKENLLHFLHKY